MKKIIDNRRYDTDTAKKVAEWDCGRARNDFSYVEETLYQKRTGEFFLYGIGGPASWCAHACPTGGYDGGEKIKPLSEEEARQWCEDRLDADDYEAIWGEPEEIAPTDTISEIRAKTGMTQEAFAKWIGVPLRTYQHWEMGDRQPQNWAVKLIAHYVQTADKPEK